MSKEKREHRTTSSNNKITVAKALELFNKSYDFSGMTVINKALEPFNKLYDFSRMTATYTVFETPSMGAFKNLVVPKEIMDKSFPYLNVSKIDVKNIFNGLSPSEYTLKNDIRENKVSSFIVKNDTTDEIPVKSLVSTISSVDVLKSITKEEALAFFHHLSRYPMLGLEHEVGKKYLLKYNKLKFLLFKIRFYIEEDLETRKRERYPIPQMKCSLLLMVYPDKEDLM